MSDIISGFHLDLKDEKAMSKPFSSMHSISLQNVVEFSGRINEYLPNLSTVFLDGFQPYIKIVSADPIFGVKKDVFYSLILPYGVLYFKSKYDLYKNAKQNNASLSN